jgi:hypothetical protein
MLQHIAANIYTSEGVGSLISQLCTMNIIPLFETVDEWIQVITLCTIFALGIIICMLPFHIFDILSRILMTEKQLSQSLEQDMNNAEQEHKRKIEIAYQEIKAVDEYLITSFSV